MNKSIPAAKLRLSVSAIIAQILAIVFAIVGLLIVNVIFNPTFWMTPDSDPVTATPLLITVLNGVFITLGAVGFLSLIVSSLLSLYSILRRRQRVL
jgi:hypothetical protein